MSSLRLVQRGDPLVLPRREYEDRWGSYLAILVSHKVLRIRFQREHVLIYPNQYVGTARCPVGTVQITARIPDLLSELKRRFPLSRRDVAGHGHLSGATASDSADLPGAFLAALRDLIQEGLPFSYVSHSYVTSSPRGRLHVGSTIRRFSSRGMHHMAVVNKAARMSDPHVVGVILEVCERLEDEGLLSTGETSALDRMWAVVVDERRAGTHDQIPLGALAAAYADRPDVVRLLALARDILSSTNTASDISFDAGKVHFRFTDADALWERAVHAVLQSMLPLPEWRVELHPLRGRQTHLFPNGGPDIDPDVIAYRRSHAPVVLDAKDFTTGAAEASGVYQVTAYARSLGASGAVLVYLTDGDGWHQSFGDANLSIAAVGVPLRGGSVLENLRRSIQLIPAFRPPTAATTRCQ